MKTPCEVVTTKVLPAVRAEIVRKLILQYGHKQLEVAAMMGLTQAAVSKYVSSSRGSNQRLLTLFPQIGKFAEQAAKQMSTSRDKEQEIQLCLICQKVRSSPNFKVYFKEVIGISRCNVCGQTVRTHSH